MVKKREGDCGERVLESLSECEKLNSKYEEGNKGDERRGGRGRGKEVEKKDGEIDKDKCERGKDDKERERGKKRYAKGRKREEN